MFLLDNSSKIIDNENGDYKVGLFYPTVFQDYDSDRVGHYFRGHDFFCRSFYITSTTGESKFLEQCEIAYEFSDEHNPPSPDGEFRIQIQVSLQNNELLMKRKLCIQNYVSFID